MIAQALRNLFNKHKKQPTNDVKEDFFLQARFGKDTRKIKKIIRKYESAIHWRNEHGDTGLIVACYNPYQEIKQLLLKEESDINAQANDGRTPLMALIYAGYEEQVDDFLKRKPNLLLRDRQDQTTRDIAKKMAKSSGVVDSLDLEKIPSWILAKHPLAEVRIFAKVDRATKEVLTPKAQGPSV